MPMGEGESSVISKERKPSFLNVLADVDRKAAIEAVSSNHGMGCLTVAYKDDDFQETGKDPAKIKAGFVGLMVSNPEVYGLVNFWGEVEETERQIKAKNQSGE
jgi:hypothetical protein